MSPIPDAIEESLSFDISQGLTGIGQLSDALDQVVQTFSVGLAAALETLTGAGANLTPIADSLDVAGLGPAVDQALVDATSTPLPIDGDTTPLTDAIDQATSTAPTLPVDGDTAPLTDAIDTATAVPQTVSVEGDTTSAVQAIDSLDNTPITLEVDADTSSAADQIDQLGQSATGAAGGSGGGGSGIAGLESVVGGLEAATGAAQGEVGGLATSIGGLSAGLGSAVAGGVVFAGFLGETAKLAADAQAQNKRFADTFGVLADQVRHIDVGGLNVSLEDLGKRSGTTQADLEATASRIGNLGKSAGASSPQIVKTTDNLLALGATFSVNNPRLGDAASVTDRLTNAFARGGRALAPFGLSLSSAQINAEAFTETGKTSAASLTLFEKSTAGANLALKVFGDTLGTKFQEGAQSAQVQFRALKVSIEETLVAVGQPLLAPLVQTFTNLLPIAQEVGRVLGALAGDVLPLVSALSSGLSPVATVLGLVADGLHLIGPAGLAAAAGLSILVPDLVLVAAGFSGATVTATAFGAALDFATGPIGIAVLALSALGLAAHVAGDAGKQAATDTSALDQAFAGSGTGAQSFTDSISGLNKSIDDYLGKQLQVQKDGTSGADTLAKLGFTFDDIKRAVGGTNDDFNNFLDRLDKAAAQAHITGAAHDQLFKIVNDGAGALDAAASNSVALAQASGLVTSAQVKAAQAQDPLNKFTDSYGNSLRSNVGVLERLQPIINANVAAQAAQTRATSDSSGAFAHLSEQIKIGAVTSADAATVATQLGISTADATTFIKSQSDAFQKNADNALLASVAGRQLTQDLQTGTISVHQAQIGFTQLGISIPGVTTAVTDAQTAVKAFVDGAVSQLPTVADAFKSATTKSKVNLDTFQQDLQKEIVQTAQFTSNLTTLVSEGFGQLAGFLASQGPQIAGQAAASLATDANRAKILDATVGLFGGAQFASAVQLRKLFPGLSEAAIQQAAGAFNAAAPAAAAAATAAGAQGGKALVDGAAGAIDLNQSARSASERSAARTGAAFQPDAATPAKVKFNAAAQAIAGLTNVPAAALIQGVNTGVSFGTGLSQGITAEIPGIQDAATKAAQAAEAAAKAALKVKSPSQVTHLIGEQFSQGLALGIVDATPQAASASVALAASVVKQLKDALAAATSQSSSAVQSAAQSAFTSFLSTATGALPSVTSDISTFSQNLTSALSAQSSALTTFHKASSTYAADQAAIKKLQGEAFLAGLALTDAQNKYNDAAAALPKKASPAQKQFVAELRQNLTAAQSTFNHFNSQLQSEVTRTATALKALGTAEAGLDKTQSALSAATDPATFTRNLRAQNAAANQFAKDIAKLSREGFTDLAKQLADAGPQAAGALARGFAKSPAKARSAEAAVDAANTFATNYQKELTRLFGPAGGAANAAHAAGTTIGQALTTGLQVASQAGTAHALGNLSQQIIAGIPNVLPLVQAAVPQKALTPVAANAPTIIQTPSLAGFGNTQTLELDLTIVLEDGKTVNAQATVPFTPPRTRSLKQLVRAQVHAS